MPVQSCDSCIGCSSYGGCSDGCPHAKLASPLTDDERKFLSNLSQTFYLPLGRFMLVPHGYDVNEGVIILSPILMQSESDSLDLVMDRADILVSLANRKLISLDFDVPLGGCTYEEYYRSDLFREFSFNFKNDKRGKPCLQRGSIAITSAGIERVEMQ